MTIQPTNSLLCIYCRDENLHLHENLYMNVYSSFICINPKLLQLGMVKQIVVHSYNGILLSNKM